MKVRNPIFTWLRNRFGDTESGGDSAGFVLLVATIELQVAWSKSRIC
jgi:hypothetical protein